MSGHSILSPSSAAVWSQCAGAPHMSKQVVISPNSSDQSAAREGNASHWVVSTALISWLHGAQIRPEHLIGQHDPDGTVIDDEMVECATVMIDAVLDVAEGLEDRAQLHVEEHMAIKSIHEECYGTPDAWLLLDGHIHLWDYKYGRKDIPADSWQNITYVAGVLDQLEVNGLADQHTKVSMYIVQPRSFTPEGPVKKKTCMASDLRAQFNVLVSQAAKVFTPDPGVSSGPHCRYCDARYICPAARKAAYAAVDYLDEAMPEELTPEAVSFELALLERAMKAMEHRYEAVKAYAISMLGSGHIVPGYTTSPGYGNRKFNADSGELVMLGELIGIDMLDDPKPISPAEFDRRLKAVNKERKEGGLEVIDATVINNYITRPSTGPKLVRSDDSQIIQAFKQ